MTAFPFLTILMIFIGVLTYGRLRATNMEKQRHEDFLNREIEANSTRKQDISALDYITIPLETFPLNLEKDEQLASYEATLQELSGKKILNLTGISNTDLKLKYGIVNLEALTEYDDNFTQLARTLVDYAARLIELGHNESAIPVLEFGIRCRTDIYSNYDLLANLYLQQNQPEKIAHLIEVAQTLTSLRKASILDCLSNI